MSHNLPSDSVESDNYVSLASNARLNERRRHYSIAMEEWEKASFLAHNTLNYDWARARMEFCRKRATSCILFENISQGDAPLI
ncbi:hypothetical protein B9P82_23880 [Citrobacter sp. L55]|uniref:ANR family transcriptional regulator n=1 Tax=Citrobacter sp. L55 TaxID=1981983 RepID=UPI000C7699E2|nr:ANR family transcriptional regulator [Citrobacter sp. L55]PLC60657.1 hypothetical protein B9P82_23880 [Citrobacter sp. L55]